MKLSKLNPRWVLLLCSLLMFLPFINRPVYVDDHAHFKQAIERGQNPTHLYSEAERGLGWRKGETPTEANPPVYFYLVGAFTRLAGTAEWKTHLLIFGLTYFGLLGFYSLARRTTTVPLWASLVWLTMPHMWLTANSLLLDSLLVPFMVGGLALFMFAWEKPSTPLLLLSSFLLGGAALVKYTGVLAVVVALLWIVIEKKEWRTPRTLVLLVPLLLLSAWGLLTRSMYNESHLAATFQSSVVFPSMTQAYFLLVFLAGAAPVLAAPLFFSGRKWPLVVALLAACLLAGVSLFSGAPLIGLQVGLWSGIGTSWLFLVVQKIKSDQSYLFLSLWVLIGLAGLLIARGWVCARYFVIIGPAMALLTAKLLDASSRARLIVLFFFGTLSARLAETRSNM
jgi:4-amino-4-deoxy-L-arabinose transferase-like glycosyltransferase